QGYMRNIKNLIQNSVSNLCFKTVQAETFCSKLKIPVLALILKQCRPQRQNLGGIGRGGKRKQFFCGVGENCVNPLTFTPPPRGRFKDRNLVL
ncbi:MAG: hypothetical protein AAB508_06485, partial [Patescibacteria group bacterium]